MVRPDDQLCPMGTSRVGVNFGPSAASVPPQALGERLVRSLGTGTVATRTVVVGMATACPCATPAEVVRRARSAATAGERRLRSMGPGSVAEELAGAVTIDVELTGHSGDRGDAPGRFVPLRLRQATHSPWDRRSELLSAAITPPFSRRNNLAVLIVDHRADRGQGRSTGLGALLAEGVARGVARTVAVADPGGPPPTVIDGVPVGVVVMALGPPGRSALSMGTGDPWEQAAEVTRSYVARGVRVVAVDSGAGLAAVAACAEAGAVAVGSVDRLAVTLVALAEVPPDGPRWPDDPGLSPLFRLLVSLSPSERRILFYMTEGWPAQEIADALVVSVTTVRSHIRSILRKLRVRSQLAAVAVVNGRDPGVDPSDPSA